MSQNIKNRLFTLVGVILIAFSVLHITNSVLKPDFTQLISVYAVGFVGLLLSFKFSTTKDLVWILLSGLIIRVFMISGTPELSNDFFRFIWDGEMMKLGILPYAKTPNEVISSAPEVFQNSELRALYHGMGELSQSNYSNYPPINEILFFIAAKLGGTLSSKIIVLRIMIILADVGIVLVGLALLKLINQNTKNILLFPLNPFIILEFTGNLHFEGVMMFFFLVAIYLYLKDLKLLSALFFAFSVLTKVLTLIFLPIFLKKGKLKDGLVYGVLVALFIGIIAYPFFSNMGSAGYTNSNLLYFQTFEFNASFYFLAREVGFWIIGYNAIAYIGPGLAFISLTLILLGYFTKRNEPISKMFTVLPIAFLIFLSFSTTVHPWYIAILLIVGIFSNYKFPILWSFLAYLSYYYYAEGMNVALFYILVAVEYILVFGLAIYEMKRELQPSKNS